MFLVRCSIASFDWSVGQSVGRSIAYVAGLLVGWGRRIERHSGTDKQSKAYEAGLDGENVFRFFQQASFAACCQVGNCNL